MRRALFRPALSHAGLKSRALARRLTANCATRLRAEPWETELGDVEPEFLLEASQVLQGGETPVDQAADTRSAFFFFFFFFAGFQEFSPERSDLGGSSPLRLLWRCVGVAASEF